MSTVLLFSSLKHIPQPLQAHRRTRNFLLLLYSALNLLRQAESSEDRDALPILTPETSENTVSCQHLMLSCSLVLCPKGKRQLQQSNWGSSWFWVFLKSSWGRSVCFLFPAEFSPVENSIYIQSSTVEAKLPGRTLLDESLLGVLRTMFRSLPYSLRPSV